MASAWGFARPIFEVEQYFLEGKELKRTAKRFVRIILKLQCYYHLEIYSGKWMEYMEIHELAASEEMFFWQVRN